ncbi:hypothetical protein KDW_62850 [Dictyobacter vulcani]|uniref:Uncharacterized protein n=1 Tax=Dictyobacter vulcani TaxID=2607529 RepID=A0A5J4KX98_9CHLR|nr:hypothetical protein [Dictyobacter vulcani]GER92123.1 hypothetical protein KDW_62850 [Dictyobacter vulcani]
MQQARAKAHEKPAYPPGFKPQRLAAGYAYVNIPPPLVEFSTMPLSTGYYQVDWTLTASNGLQTLPEHHEHTIYYALNACMGDTDIPQRLKVNSAQATALAKQHIQVTYTACGFGSQLFNSVNTGPFLLTAIDPAAENQLLHLDKYWRRGR